jgi:hypothetical protein
MPTDTDQLSIIMNQPRDYHTEPCDFEATLGNVNERDHMRGLNDDLRKTTLAYERMEYDEFVAKALQIDQAGMKDRKKPNNDGKEGTKSQLQQSQCFWWYCSSRLKPAARELKPEISRQEADRLHLCRHCKKPGSIHRNRPLLRSKKRAASASLLSISASSQRLTKCVKYVTMDTRTYRQRLWWETGGRQALKRPSWSVFSLRNLKIQIF